MLFPMSWTSPFTVASTSRSRRPPIPSDEPSGAASGPASMYGSNTATARFITRALFTTCGRNIRPSPNRSPTIRIPSINGPSITASGDGISRRASSASSSMWSRMPWTTAWDRRSATGASRRFATARASGAAARAPAATATSRSVASGRRASTTSSTRSRKSPGMSS